MTEFEDAAKLLSKTVTDLKQQKKRLEIDVVSLDAQVQEARRKLYKLGGNISMIEKQKETLEAKITEETETMKTAKSQQLEEIANKKDLAEIEIVNSRKKLEKEREELEKDKKKHLTEFQALGIYELDLKNFNKELEGKSHDIEVERKSLSEQKSLADQKIKLAGEKEAGLREERLQLQKDFTDKKDKIDSELQETEKKLKEANSLSDSLHEKASQVSKIQENMKLKSDVLNKKAFVLEGKERDIRRRELRIQDREATNETHSRL